MSGLIDDLSAIRTKGGCRDRFVMNPLGTKWLGAPLVGGS